MAQRRCDVVIDTSIAWAAAAHKAQKAIRRFFAGLREKYRVCYTEHVRVELSLTGFTGFRVRSILSSIAEPVTTGIEPVEAFRYKAARKIGVSDVLIAVAAERLGAVLATGDWPQAKFYMDLTGGKPIYLPLVRLEEMGEPG